MLLVWIPMKLDYTGSFFSGRWSYGRCARRRRFSLFGRRPRRLEEHSRPSDGKALAKKIVSAVYAPITVAAELFLEREPEPTRGLWFAPSGSL